MRFYVLKTHLTDKYSDACTEVIVPLKSPRGQAPRCATCGRTIGMLSRVPPFRVILEARGVGFGDFAFYDVGDSMLISARFRQIYEREGLIGLSGFEPVEVLRIKRRKKNLADPPRYLRVAICRSRTAIDLAASEFDWESPPTCLDCLRGSARSWKHTIIDQSTWEGEDIFIARGLADFIVTQRFKDVCEAHRVTNAIFVPAEESGHDFYAAGKL
jgi:hypothetical protein